LLFLRHRYAIHVSREAALMAMLTSGLLIACGFVGSRYWGLSVRMLSAKAAICVVAWLLAYAIMPAEDRARLRSGGARIAEEALSVVRSLKGGA
jgi:hypothetical protein